MRNAPSLFMVSLGSPLFWWNPENSLTRHQLTAADCLVGRIYALRRALDIDFYNLHTGQELLGEVIIFAPLDNPRKINYPVS